MLHKGLFAELLFRNEFKYKFYPDSTRVHMYQKKETGTEDLKKQREYLLATNGSAGVIECTSNQTSQNPTDEDRHTGGINVYLFGSGAQVASVPGGLQARIRFL